MRNIVLFFIVLGPSLFHAEVTAQELPTFSQDIAPIFYEKCVTCHRPDQAAPFSLITYEQVSRRARLCAKLIEAREMPPWKPVAGHGKFKEELQLSEEEIDLFHEWVEGGKPEGDPADLPPLPEFPERWKLGEPDLILQMPSAYQIPADGPDIYRNFVVDTGLEEDVWIRAVEIMPGTPRVVHHVVMFSDLTGLARELDAKAKEVGFSEMIPPSQLVGGYAPGMGPTEFPENLSIELAKGSDLVLQTHFHPTGRPEAEQLEIGLYFADKPSERSVLHLQIPELFGIGMGIDVPAGDDNYVVEHEIVLPTDAVVYGVRGHAHYIGKEMQLTAKFPDGKTESIFFIRDWDLDWQSSYLYETPLELPEGTTLKARILYDNSASNTNNPYSPPRRIAWGKESTDEMGSVTVMLTPKEENDVPALKDLAVLEKRRALVGLFRGGKLPSVDEKLRMPSGAEVLKTFDEDSSGGLTFSEFPVQPQADRFEKLDRDGDGHLDKDELNSMMRLMNLAMRFGMGEGAGRSLLLKTILRRQFD